MVIPLVIRVLKAKIQINQGECNYCGRCCAYSRTHHGAMETHVCVARYDISGITIWSSCQGAYESERWWQTLGMSYHQVRVIKPLWERIIWRPEAILGPGRFSGQETRAAVMLKLNRKECIISTMTRPQVETRIKTIYSLMKAAQL